MNKGSILKGLKQGNSLATFLFLLVVVEGLSASIKKTVLVGTFKGFRVSNDVLEVSHLSYVDDTEMVGVR